MNNEPVTIKLGPAALFGVVRLLEDTRISDVRFTSQEIVALHALLQELHLYTDAKVG